MKRFYIPILSLILLISGFSFVVNSATYISDSQKQIIRDSKRLNDLTLFKKAIEDYKTKNGYYPKLDTGTNVKGYVNSVWGTQWTSFCSLIGLSSCPVDPVNSIKDCSCVIFSSNGVCSGNNIDSNINKSTCFNSKDQKFACAPGSNIYQYKVLNNGRNYEFGMEFEYRKDGDYTAGADYWNVNNYDNGNYITIDNNCSGNPAKVISNSLPKCGDRIIQPGEQCDGNDKIEFCTNPKGELGKMVIKCNSCFYEVKNTKLTSECSISDFCGDGMINSAKGEECDGGYEKMCFNSENNLLGQHDWYTEKLRYCQNNCKWNTSDSYRDSLTPDMCGGYCGDGKIQGTEDCDFGVEYSFWDDNVNAFKKCSDYNSQDLCPISKCNWSNNSCVKKTVGTSSKEKHCYIRNGSSCKYINNSPSLPVIKNSNFSALSYIKEGDNYTESVSSINESNLFVKRTSRNSVYLEFSLEGVATGSDNISDVDGDEIMYKLEFVNKANNSIGFYKSNDVIGNNSILSTTRGSEITNKWIKHSDIAKIDPSTGKYTKRVFFRIYSTALSSNYDQARSGIISLLDGAYFGDYKFKITVKDSWSDGANVDGNRQGVENSKEISFYIGSSCGDHVLQAINDEGQHEYCEWKPGYDKFTNWSVNEPSGNGNCATIKTGLGWNSKWDDVPCGDLYHGICKKIMSQPCPSGWISIKNSDGNNICYGLTQKTTYDSASTECYFEYDKAYLVNILNPAENNEISKYIKGDYPDKKFNYTGDPVFWIGFYNIKKLRTEAQNNFPADTNPLSLWVPSVENGNPDVYSGAMYNGGSGKNFSSQFLCSNTCNDVGGYCGDGILENGTQELSNPSFYTIQTNADKSTIRNFYLGNFEQCDPTSQGKDASYVGQTGLGTGWYLQSDGTKIGDNYGCVACSLVGGYCGSGTINNAHFNQDGYKYFDPNDVNKSGVDYEHCDPRYVLRPQDSGSNKNTRGSKPNYICALGGNPGAADNISVSDASSNLYKIPNPKSEARMTWIAYNDMNADGSIKGSPLTLKQFIDEPNKGKSFGVNANGACQNSTGGYCGDGKIQMGYIGFELSQSLDESYAGSSSHYKSSYSGSELLYNDKDISLGKVLDIKRKIVVGTSNYRNYSNLDSSGNITGVVSNIVSSNKGLNPLNRNYNYGVNNNNTYVGDINNSGKFDNTGSNSFAYWLEKCDPKYFPNPYETNNLSSGSFYKKVDEDLNYLADNNFNGFGTLRYQCSDSGNPCDFKTYKVNTTDALGKESPIKFDANLVKVDYSIGFCGDGVVTGYGNGNGVDPIVNTTEANREKCDPKNYIVGPNGSNSGFGDNALYGCRRNTQFNYYNSSFVFGKDCSTYVTPATSSENSTYSCSFDCTPADDSKGGGYCGDGKIQSQFFEECDPGDSKYGSNGVLNNFANADFKSNYVCGVKNGYEDYSFDSEYQNNEDLKKAFDSTSFRDDDKNQNGKVASCRSFGGYCGDGSVQVCNIDNDFYGASKNYNSCYGMQFGSTGEYSYVDASGNVQNYVETTFASTGGRTIETCDSNENACFIVSGGVAVKPLLISNQVDFYDFKNAQAGYKSMYAELSGYNFNGAGKPGSSGPYAPAGECGSSNALYGIFSSHQLTDLCNIGSASTVRFDTASKRFEWNCNGFNGGKTVSCYADTQFNALPINGSCGSDSDYVCGEPSCTKSGAVVYEGEECDAGSDCINKKISETVSMKICNVECFYKGKQVSSGEACASSAPGANDAGRTCSTTIKQKFSNLKAIKNKCNTGFAGDLSNDGTNWKWVCFGLNGGSTANCSAVSSLAIKGKCGTNFGTCFIGIADKPKFSNSKNKWEWKCSGFNGGDYDSCEAPGVGLEKLTPPACGPNNGGTFISLNSLMNSGGNVYNPFGLCTKGIPSTVTLSGNTYNWKCSAGGSNASCFANVDNNSANAKNGSCSGINIAQSSSLNLCSQGYPSNIMYVPAFGKLKWDCKGVGVNAANPVKDAKCSALVPTLAVSGECGDPFNMFVSSSGAQTPSVSNELKQATDEGRQFQGLQFQLCKSGYANNLSCQNDSDCPAASRCVQSGYDHTKKHCSSWADNIMQMGETPGNRCDSSSNSYLSSDCMNLQLNLPFIGKLDLFHMTMPWQWKCNGVNGGASPSCFIFNPSMFFSQSGSCGDDARKICKGNNCGTDIKINDACSNKNGTSGAPADCKDREFADASLVSNRCYSGYSTDVNISEGKINWSCKGFNGGSVDNCSANLKTVAKVDGACGGSQGQSNLWSYSSISNPCSNGVFADLSIIKHSTNNTVQWSWNCKGISGGKTVNCLSNDNWKNASDVKVTVIDGECSNLSNGIYKSSSDIYSAGGCANGLINGIRYNSSSNKFQWSCLGSSDGAVDRCEVTAGNF